MIPRLCLLGHISEFHPMVSPFLDGLVSHTALLNNYPFTIAVPGFSLEPHPQLALEG
jgi:hypothetical protein